LAAAAVRPPTAAGMAVRAAAATMTSIDAGIVMGKGKTTAG
jgi:hypothetical protein